MPSIQAVPDSFVPQSSGFQQLSTYFDERYQIAWGYMHSEPRPCFTMTLLNELVTWFAQLQTQIDSASQTDVHYHVVASAHSGVFNLGGDLSLFHSLIQQQNRARLLEYAKACIAPLYLNATHLDRPNLKSICLVQGDALGGGFECALSGNVIIAERGSKMGFPEILFNLFPGMGALTLLSRRVGAQQAEKIILGGNIYMAEQLYEMGVIDILAEPGQGTQAVYEFVRREGRARNGALALRAARERMQPVSLEELLDITEIWVDAALRIEPKDLRMMERLVARQGGKIAQGSPDSATPDARLAG